MTYRSWTVAAAVVLVAMTGATAHGLSIVTVPVGNAGNAADSATGSLYGAVSYAYSIGKYDVTNVQYAEFLTDKAASSDPYGLWNNWMSSDPEGGINRSGSGPFTYTVKSGQENQPVADVTWFDTIRFVNWLQNGQASGDTESGTYAISGSGPNWTVAVPSAAQRATWANAGQTHWLLPSEDEWYKAAYYDPTLNSRSGGYWQYPTKSNAAPTSEAPSSGYNSANFSLVMPGPDCLTDVGAYAGSTSFYGTLDQGGDVFQWNEADINGDGSSRGLRGGSWQTSSSDLSSSWRFPFGFPSSEGPMIGFRVAIVAMVPEPGSVTLIVWVAIGALIWWRRRS